MVSGMATKKVTITLEAEQLREIQGLVAAGKLESVSGFVQHAVTTSLADMAGWRALLDDALQQTGGPLTRAERAWADGILSGKSRPRRKDRTK